jgi:hypothetical protein
VATVPNAFALNKESGDLFCWSKSTGLERLTSGEKFTGIQHTASGFIAHRFSANRKSTLVITDERGQPLETIDLPIHSLAHDISNTSSGITFVLSSSSENGLYELHPGTLDIQRIVTNDNATLRSPLKLKDWLLYTSDETGIDQPMAMSLSTQEHFQIATRPYGTYFLTATENENQIVYADYQPGGQQLVHFGMPLTEATPSNWLNKTTLSSASTFVENLIDPDVVSGLTTAMQSADIENYTLSKYRPHEHLWNPHSWGVMATQNQLYGFINSQDVLDKLAMNIQAGVDFSEVETFASINTTYRLNSGLQISAAAQKNIGDERLVAQISRPLQWRHGDVTTLVTPRTAVEVSSVFPARAAVELSVTTQKDRGFHQLQTPLGIHQRLYTDIDADSHLRLLSSTSFATLGLSSTHALNADVEMQWLEIGPSLLANDPVLSPISYTGFSAQATADYRVNLGQVGKSLLPGLYWRNTELSLNGRTQHQTSGQESAIGFTLQPSFNLLQNANLILNPSASFYYLIDSDAVRFTLGASIANF